MTAMTGMKQTAEIAQVTIAVTSWSVTVPNAPDTS